jgi:TRAP-type C4-dicarboxylate transport system permease small subunit
MTSVFFLAPDGKVGDRSPDDLRAEWLTSPRSRGFPVPVAAPAAVLGTAGAGVGLGVLLLASRPPARGRERMRVIVLAWVVLFAAAVGFLGATYASEAVTAQSHRALGDPLLILGVLATALLLAFTGWTARNLS